MTATERRFGAWWVVVCATGGALAGLSEARLQFLGQIVLTGALVGLAQWTLLRRVLPRAAAWVLLSAGGWIAAYLIVTQLPNVIGRTAATLSNRGLLWEVFWINLLQMPLVLAIFGLAQAFALPSPHLRKGAVWVGINLLGGAALGATGATACYLACDGVAVTLGGWAVGLLLGAAAWAVYGLMTGPVLAWLLQPQLRAQLRAQRVGRIDR